VHASFVCSPVLHLCITPNLSNPPNLIQPLIITNHHHDCQDCRRCWCKFLSSFTITRTDFCNQASGNVGTPVVQALLDAGFSVTAITRENSKSTFSPAVQVRRADLSSVSSVTAAFAGHDAVVVTIATSEVGNQNVLADAAVAAGVRRFVPSEFGHNTARLSGPLAILLADKAQTAAYLTTLSEKNPSFSWTGVATSPFFDWGLDNGVFGVALRDRTVRIIDSGDEPVSASTLAFVGRSVAAVLGREDEAVRNKVVDVVEFTVSQNQIVGLLEELTGQSFQRTYIKGADLARSADDKLAKGDYGGAFIDALLAWNFIAGGNNAVPDSETANGLLGLQSEDLRKVLEDYVKTRSA